MVTATTIATDELTQEFSAFFIDDEKIEIAFCVRRNKWVFTNKRLIIRDTSIISASTHEYLTIPYSSIVRFSISPSNGSMSELNLWIIDTTKESEKLYLYLDNSDSLKDVQQILAKHILK